jgi:hypothetical protein
MNQQRERTREGSSKWHAERRFGVETPRKQRWDEERWEMCGERRKKMQRVRGEKCEEIGGCG